MLESEQWDPKLQLFVLVGIDKHGIYSLQIYSTGLTGLIDPLVSLCAYIWKNQIDSMSFISFFIYICYLCG